MNDEVRKDVHAFSLFAKEYISTQNYKTAHEYMRDAGAVITCTETVLF